MRAVRGSAERVSARECGQCGGGGVGYGELAGAEDGREYGEGDDGVADDPR